MTLWLALIACGGPEPADTAEPSYTSGVYHVVYRTEPDPPVAGEPAEVWLQVLGPDDEPVQDLQQSHERLVHTLIIPHDLSSFAHVHHEDHDEVTADDLREATFHLPYTFEKSGPYKLIFDYASQNEYRSGAGDVDVTGAPAQADAPTIDLSTTVQVGDLTATWRWDVPPSPGAEAAFTITLADSAGDVTDVVPWLGADGHVAIVSVDLSVLAHTHAYVPGMEDAPPGHEMPHVHDGPELPFRYVFPTAGTYKLWIQFARATAPDDAYVVPFMIEVPE